MNDKSWILFDTETTGLAAPIFVVELAAQRMRGWSAEDEPFRELLNQNIMPISRHGPLDLAENESLRRRRNLRT
jgi:hypothetical protein